MDRDLYSCFTYFKRRHAMKKHKEFEFYHGETESNLEGGYIDEFLRLWYPQYSLLEKDNLYIKWLFPLLSIHDKDFNSEGPVPIRSMHEVDEIKDSFDCGARLVLSYRLMLNFIGLRLVDEKTGQVERNKDIWQPRYANLNMSPQSHQRISRVLKSLNLLGFARYTPPLVKFLGHEIREEKLLPNCKGALENFWEEIIADQDAKNAKESVFFKHLIENSPEYKDYRDGLARGRHWLHTDTKRTHQDEAALIEEFNQTLQQANKFQAENFDPDMITNRMDEFSAGQPDNSTSHFKLHYNNEKEKEQATQEFLKEIEKGREHARAERERAALALKQLMAEQKNQA